MIVLDTDVVSELMRSTPSPVVEAWVRARSSQELYTTSITVAEIGYGIERLADGARKTLLATTARQLFSAFAEHVLAFDTVAAGIYGSVVRDRDRAGAPIDGFDAQIASICRIHDATLATRNVKDFSRTGIDVINPWQTDN
jgi:predicted nucleic acid-binding protein